MSTNSELNNVTPLSQATLNRKSHGNISEITKDDLKEILSDIVDNKITAKLTRIENSIHRMANQFEAIRNGDTEDAALRVRGLSSNCTENHAKAVSIAMYALQLSSLTF